MSLSTNEPGRAGKSPPLSILARLGRARSNTNSAATQPAGTPASPAAAPAPDRAPVRAPLSAAAQAVQTAADALIAGPNWMLVALADGGAAGVRFIGGELHAWAISGDDPLRAIPVAVIIDGSVVMEAFTAPADGVLLIAGGWHLTGHAALELAVAGERFTGIGFSEPNLWPNASARAEAAATIERVREQWRDQAMRRHAQQDIAGTLARLARPGAQDPREGQPAAFLRYLASSTNTPIRGTGPLALANWVISDVMEDPLRRELFCLDTATAEILNEPAFNTRALRGDVSLALLCFWRRHYPSLDLFGDEGLRRLVFKFVTAPYIRLKNNAALVSPGMRALLSAPATGRGAGSPAWSWYWTCLHTDQDQAARLEDFDYHRMLTFREVAADAADPGRLSFSPDAWAAWWSGWACGAGVGFSRFDLALIAMIEPSSPPAALVAEHGAAVWRDRLQAAFYDAIPGLSALSLACDPAEAPAPSPPAACDLAIIGYTNGTGLARNMAMFVEALAPLAPAVFDARSGRCVTMEQAPLRARVVLLCVNAGHAPEVIGRFAALCSGAHIVTFYLWETDQPPEQHRFGANVVDEIWTPSHYVADAYRGMTDVPVSVVGKGLRPPPAERWQAAGRRFRNHRAFTFLYVADFSSSIVRKNPLAGVQAFLAAFGPDNTGVRMVIKLREIDRMHWSNIDGYWEELERLVGSDPRVSFLIGELTDDEYWALLGSCDALVSLHRGEGFCYPLADAMLLGRPVVVTDYSGTADFCTAETAFLVEADIVPTPPHHLRCTTPIGNWAIPRIDSAAAAMRAVVSQRAEAARRAAAGEAMVAGLYDFEAWRASLLARLAPHLNGRGVSSGRLTLSSLAPAWPGSDAPC